MQNTHWVCRCADSWRVFVSLDVSIVFGLGLLLRCCKDAEMRSLKRNDSMNHDPCVRSSYRAPSCKLVNVKAEALSFTTRSLVAGEQALFLASDVDARATILVIFTETRAVEPGTRTPSTRLRLELQARGHRVLSFSYLNCILFCRIALIHRHVSLLVLRLAQTR